MLRRALADAVLQAKITKGQPCAKPLHTLQRCTRTRFRTNVCRRVRGRCRPNRGSRIGVKNRRWNEKRSNHRSPNQRCRWVPCSFGLAAGTEQFVGFFFHVLNHAAFSVAAAVVFGFGAVAGGFVPHGADYLVADVDSGAAAYMMVVAPALSNTIPRVLLSEYSDGIVHLVLYGFDEFLLF